MDKAKGKIPKACEPCRRRKIRCDGDSPCLTCQHHPSQCVYRSKARTRTRLSNRAASESHELAALPTQASLDEPLERTSGSPRVSTPPRDRNEAANPEVYHGISAAHAHGASARERAQLFYGPSSNFAFIQQLRRGIVRHGIGPQPAVREGGKDSAEDLDMFMQRDVFFGTQSRMSDKSPCDTTIALSQHQAIIFLRQFKRMSWDLLPLFTEADLDRMLADLRLDLDEAAPRSQQNALALAVLAIGALCTPETTIAESLYEKSKIAAIPYDELVSLSMIQLPILLAEYQVSMGRPTSAYVHLGTAARKALAAGLYTEPAGSTFDNETMQQRRCTMWCLYFHEQ